MKKLNLLLSLILSGCFFANAQWSQLDHELFEGSDNVNGIMKKGSSYIMATDGGVFKSNDNGASWAYSSTDLEQTNVVKNIVKFNNNLYLMDDDNDIYLSTDNGDSWSPAVFSDLPDNANIQSIGSANNKLFAIIQVWGDMGQDSLYIYYSSNGTSWTQGKYLESNNKNVEFAYLSNDSMYYLKDDSLFYTKDGINVHDIKFDGLGTSQIDNSSSLTGEFHGKYIYYNKDNDVYRYDPDLQVWESKINGINPVGLGMVGGLNTTDSVAFVGTVYMAPLAAKLYRSTDHCNNWVEVTDHGIPIPIFREGYSVAQLSSADFVGGNVIGDIYYSLDTGLTWNNGTEGFLGRDNSGLFIKDNNFFTLQGQYGVIKSTDEGETWSYSNYGLDSIFGIRFVREMFNIGDTIYLTSQLSPFDENLYLFRSEDNGANWEQMNTTPDSNYCLFAGRNGNTIIMKFFSDRNGYDDETKNAYFRSSDGGNTWTNMSSFITDLDISQVSGFSGKGDSLFLFARDNMWNDVSYVSTDDGDNWDQLTNNTFMGGSYLETTYGNNGMSKVVMGFGGPGNRPVIAKKFYTMNNNYIDSLLTLNEDTWVTIPATGLPENTSIRDIKYYKGCWYITTRQGMYYSNDNCYTWKEFDNTGIYKGMEDMSIVFNINDIFIGTSNNGIWKTSFIPETGVLGEDVEICASSDVELDAGSGHENYTWSTGDITQAIIIDSAGIGIGETTVWVEMTDDDGYVSVDTINISFTEGPTADAGIDQTICKGSMAALTASGAGVDGSYEWNTGETTSSINVLPGSTTTYTITVEDHVGCTDADLLVVVVTQATADAGNDVTICSGGSSILGANGGEEYEWSTGATTQSITVSPSADSTYIVTVSDQYGCVDNDSVTVSIGIDIVVNAGDDVTICSGSSTTLQASGGINYAWAPSAGLSNASIYNPVASPATTTTYMATIDDGACTGTDNVIVTVIPIPTADAGIDQTITIGNSATLTATGGGTYEWNTDETALSITVTPVVTTTYTVTVTGANGCTDADEVVVTVSTGINDISDNAYIKIYPNPANGVFYLSIEGLNINDLSLSIFNIHGQLIYSERLAKVTDKFTKKLDLSAFDKGIYFIKLINKDIENR